MRGVALHFPSQRVKILAKQAVFTPKTSRFSCHCEAAEQPWQSESQRYGIPWRNTEARSKRESLSQKHGIRRFISLSLSLFQGFVSFRATIFRYGMTNRFVKDCRVGRKKCALLAMTESLGLIKNTERKIQSLESVKRFLFVDCF